MARHTLLLVALALTGCDDGSSDDTRDSAPLDVTHADPAVDAAHTDAAVTDAAPADGAAADAALDAAEHFVAEAAQSTFAVAPLDIITLEAIPPRDPHGASPQRFRWTVVERPFGSTSQPVEAFDSALWSSGTNPPDRPATPTAEFFVDLAGRYVIALAVTDRDAPPGPDGTTLITIDAVPETDVYVEIVWHTPDDPDQTDDDGTDVDLWLLHPAAAGWHLDARGLRCSFDNPHPDWGREDDRSDDPAVALIDNNGAGPEVITLDQPEDTGALGAPYRIAAHYERASRSVNTPMLTSVVTARVYLDGALAAELDRALEDRDDFWEIAAIVWSGADRRVQVIDRFQEHPPR